MFRALCSMRVITRTLLALPVIMAACTDQTADVKPDAAFVPYIPAFTAGHIPARSPILVRIAPGQTFIDSSATAINELFDLEPSVEGTVTWSDHLTLSFQPNERLKHNQTYTVSFKLGKLIELPKDLGDFRFQVTTYAQSIDLKVDDMQAISTTDLTWQRVHAAVYTSDEAGPEELERAVVAEQNGRRLTLHWEHEPNGNQHRVLADSVKRGDEASTVIWRWDAKEIEGEGSGELPFQIPAIGDLQWISTSTVSEGEQHAIILFSDPLDPAQNLEGLAGIAGVENVRLTVDGNKLLMYPTGRLSGEHSGFVAAGLANINHKPLGKDLTLVLEFEDLKPNVRISGKGTILPSTSGLVFPFEAVNLNAVDVRVVRIYADNVPQFLQVNDLAGSQELARVGRLVLKKKVPLVTKEKSAQGQWNPYFLDLDELIKTEPGAIYRISLGFRKSYSTYACPDDGTNQGELSANEVEQETEDDGQWDNPNQNYWYYDDYYEGEEYEYSEREQPCSASYFRNKGTVAERNILASDIGLIAKRGNDGSLWVAASDLRTAKPMSGVTIDVLDLQRRSLGAPLTDGEGLVTLPSLKHKPFLLIASKGNQRGYLRLDDGSSLNVSSFDVEGSAVDKGLKGFLYGERGVWRPGDSLFLTFILQETEHKLPKDHPVVLELTDPQGRMDQRIVRTSGVQGTYAFHCATDANAPTGVWGATVRVGGTTFYKPLRIETVKPNRLKINIDLGERITVDKAEQKVNLQANWLHGAPARELKARTTVTLTRANASFKGFDKYVFNDLNTDLNTEEITVFDGTLTAEGHTAFPFDLQLNNRAPAAVNANVVTRVFEAGGDASVDRTDVTYYPYATYCGVKVPEPTGWWGAYHTDTTYTIEAIALDPNGKPLTGHSLKAQVVKVSHNWWWDEDVDAQSSYMTAPSSSILGEQDLKTDAKGRTTFTFRVNKPNWGRYVVRLTDPASQHVSAAQLYVDWAGSYGRSRREGDKDAAMLTFNADKEKYNVGDNCTLTFPSGGTGRAFVSLETGTRILDAKWVDLKDKETSFSFPITAEMAPNIYAQVMVIQPHEALVPKKGEKEMNSRPIRLYGVIPILVEDPATHLKPVITMAKEIKTDEPFNVEVSEASGEEMTYTLAIVDEGLLDLTRFKTPDPWAWFYAREALGVRTWDLYDHVIGAFGQQLQRILALGGSDQASPDAAAKVNRFKPVVRFVGPLRLGKGKKAQHSFSISNYVGSVRVMVIANDGERAYGSTEKTVPVKKALMLLATLPRVVGPGETVDLPVTVFAMDPKVRNVSLKLEANNLFTVESSTEQQLTFQKTGDQVATFRVRMAERAGAGKVKLIAEGAGERATHTIDIAVRQPNLPQTDQTEAVLDAGKSWEDAPMPVGIEGTNSAYLEVSSIPAVDLGYRLQYLIDYPHGCIEQTTSAAFPQLFLATVIEVDARTAQTMRGNVEAALRRLKLFQLPSGGFSYWPGESELSDWGSVYAGHFLVEADRAGYALPPGMKAKWLGYMRTAARDWNSDAAEGWREEGWQLTQAYRLYVMALANAADQAAMNRLRTAPNLHSEAKWMLAAAYAMGNNKAVAAELVMGLSTQVQPYNEMSWTYGSDLRDDAIIAEALLRMDDRTRGGVVIKRIAENLGKDSWYSTQSTAWGLLAVSRLATASDMGKGINVALTVNGKPDNRVSSKSVLRVDLPVPDGKKKVSVTNNGKGLLYVRTVRKGTPMPGEESAASNGIAADVRYQRMDGTLLDPTTLEQGTDFQAVVTIQHPGIRDSYAELALTQVFPSGWEIRNSRLEGTESAQQNSWFQYQDIRDDRVMTYFDLGAGQQATYRVFLNASYTGRFYLPPTVCEAMYDHTVNARSPGRWVNVVKAGEGRAGK